MNHISSSCFLSKICSLGLSSYIQSFLITLFSFYFPPLTHAEPFSSPIGISPILIPPVLRHGDFNHDHLCKPIWHSPLAFSVFLITSWDFRWWARVRIRKMSYKSGIVTDSGLQQIALFETVLGCFNNHPHAISGHRWGRKFVILRAHEFQS